MPANRELPGSPVLIRSQQEIARRQGGRCADTNGDGAADLTILVGAAAPLAAGDFLM